MRFKTLTIKEAVYNELLKTKGSEESFSNFLGRLVRKSRPDFTKFYGAWNVSEKEWDKIEKLLKRRRKEADKNYRERIKRLFS